MCCRDERTKRVRAVYAPFIEICCAAYNTHHHTTPHHNTTPPPPLSPILFLSSLSPTFFTHTKENNRLPFDTKFFANLHDDRLRSKIGKIQLMTGKNIMHTVTALNKRKTESNQTKKVSQRLIKTRPLDETPKSNVCKIQTIIWQTILGKKLKN